MLEGLRKDIWRTQKKRIHSPHFEKEVRDILDSLYHINNSLRKESLSSLKEEDLPAKI